MNTFGRIFRLTDFGESHGPAMGGVIDGVPARFILNLSLVQEYVDMRRPGSRLQSPRREADCIEWLSGLDRNGVTLGTPIGFLIRNTDVRPDDYKGFQKAFRPGHADYVTFAKYGIQSGSGGGRTSARQTVCRVVAGAVAAQMLEQKGVQLRAFVSAIGSIIMDEPYAVFPDRKSVFASPVRCPDEAISSKMQQFLINEILGKDSVGGRVSVICRGLEPGIGSPVYHKLTARLAAAMMSINAAKAIEFGLGAESAFRTGTTGIDSIISATGQGSELRLHTAENLSGGIDGGLSNGEDITLSVYFKPTPTRPYPVKSYNSDGEPVIISAGGRHDPCVAIRAVPVVEAMAAMTLLDEMLINRSAGW